MRLSLSKSQQEEVNAIKGYFDDADEYVRNDYVTHVMDMAVFGSCQVEKMTRGVCSACFLTELERAKDV